MIPRILCTRSVPFQTKNVDQQIYGTALLSSLLPFIMYSFSDDPGSVRALKRFVSSISMYGAISAGVILQRKRQYLDIPTAYQN